MGNIRYKFINENVIEPIDFNKELSSIKSSYELTLKNNNVEDENILKINSKKLKTKSDKKRIKLRIELDDFFLRKIKKIEDEYLILVEDEKPELSSKFDSYSIIYKLDKIKKQIIKRFEIQKNNKQLINFEISRLMKELKSEDYKINKCYEYLMVKKELPYDIISLNIKRDKIRDEIKRLKSL